LGAEAVRIEAWVGVEAWSFKVYDLISQHESSSFPVIFTHCMSSFF